MNLCENNVEGWIMMIVETTCGGRPRVRTAGVFMFLRMAGWFLGCIAHPSETHNRGSFLPVLPQVCADRQISPLSPLLELGAKRLLYSGCTSGAYFSAKLPRGSVTDRLIMTMKALRYT